MAPPLLLLWAAAALYAAASAVAWANLVMRRTPGLPKPVGALLGGGAVFHSLGLAIRAWELSGPPVTGGLEGLSILAWMLVLVFLGFVRSYPVGGLGALVAPLATLTLAAALVLGRAPADVPQSLKTGYFWVHISLAFAGNALLAMAASAGVAYVLQDRNMRLRRLDEARALPTLNVADALAYRAATMGFLFMTLGIASGMAYSKYAWHAWWSWDPRQTWSLMTWLCYAALLHVRLLSGWRGRRWAWMTVGAFSLVIAASVFLDVFNVGRHSGDYDSRPGPAAPGGA